MASAFSRALAWPLIGLVKLYRLAISPWLGMNCRFQPTCSEYAIEALRKHGVFKERNDTDRQITTTTTTFTTTTTTTTSKNITTSHSEEPLRNAAGQRERGEKTRTGRKTK